MARATAVIIGVDDGPAIQQYHLPILTYAENGACKIAEYASDLLYDPITKLIGPDATYDRVDDALRRVAEAQPAWETVLIVFSGHGFRKNSGRRCNDQLDEHWCLHDKLMVDDHLLMRTQKFASTTRVFIVADCCFAARGSGFDGLPKELIRRALNVLPDRLGWRRTFWENDVDAGRKRVWEVPHFDCSSPKAELLLLASSAQSSAEAGPFMDAFLKAWAEPRARSSFSAFADRMRTLGGKPVLLPNDSPLLKAPAFMP